MIAITTRSSTSVKPLARCLFSDGAPKAALVALPLTIAHAIKARPGALRIHVVNIVARFRLVGRARIAALAPGIRRTRTVSRGERITRNAAQEIDFGFLGVFGVVHAFRQHLERSWVTGF